MSDDDWIAEYERLVADLPAPVPIAQWTEGEAREQAKRAWMAEIENKHGLKALLGAVRKVKRALDDQDKLGNELERLPTLSVEEEEALRDDMLWSRRRSDPNFAGDPLAEEDFHLILRMWVEEFDVSRGLRGAGRPEWRPGLVAAAFVLCDWFTARNDQLPKAMLYSKSADAGVNDWTAREDGVAYSPSEDVKWLATELVLLDRSLDTIDEEGRPLALHQADNFIGLWREARGLKRSRSNSSGISETD